MDNQRHLHEVLRELAAQRGVDAHRIAELTNIQQSHVEALLDGRHRDLPPAPYVHGYLVKLASLFGVAADELTKLHGEAAARTSGIHDRLPVNRFALRKFGMKRIALAVAVIGLLTYGSLRFNAIIGKPTIRLEAPAAATIVVNDPSFTIRGVIDPSDKLTINDEETTADTNGYLEKSITLQPGINTIHLVAKRFLGRTTDELRQVIYQQSNAATSTGTY